MRQRPTPESCTCSTIDVDRGPGSGRMCPWADGLLGLLRVRGRARWRGGRCWSWAQRFAPGRRCAIGRLRHVELSQIEGVCSWCRRARCVSHTRPQSGVIAARGSGWLLESGQKVVGGSGWPRPPQQIIPRCWNIVSKIKLKLKLKRHAGIVYVSRICQ